MNSKRVFEEYSEALVQHKKMINTNTYARELELRYHKNYRRRFMKQINCTPSIEETSIWPIDSPVFNEVLKSKLKNVSTVVTPLAKVNKKVLTDLKKNLHFRFLSGDYNLPKIDKNRFWSPPKLRSKLTVQNEKEPKEFGPKIKPIQFIQKSLLY